jgi:hydroxypyruvate reductase
MNSPRPAEDLRNTAREIFLHALHQCSISAAFAQRARITTGRQGTQLLLPTDQGSQHALLLDGYRCIHLFAMGKAALPMLDAVLARLPSTLQIKGLCTAPVLPATPDPRIQYFAGGHPLPNTDSFAAARAMLHHAQQLDKRDFALFLISGGASAMLELPCDQLISLEDTIAFHRALVHSGATIAEINCVRKHFSAIKGGRLGSAARHAHCLSLLVSDVPLRHLDALASSPTLPDRSTVAECREILARYLLLEQFPASVRRYFEQPNLPETPKHLSPDGEPGNSASQFAVLLSNEYLVAAAKKYAGSLGFHVEVDNTCDDWDCAAAADYLLRKLRTLRQQHARVCLLSGGEVTVQISGNPGTGGRNQQFALSCAAALHVDESGLAILSAGSDGIDGNSTAAGAIADNTTLARAQGLQWSAEAALHQFNAAPLFAALNDAIVTGPTGNNLRDLRILLSFQR